MTGAALRFEITRLTRAHTQTNIMKSIGSSDTQKFAFLRTSTSVTTSSVKAARSWLEAPNTGQICIALPLMAR